MLIGGELADRNDLVHELAIGNSSRCALLGLQRVLVLALAGNAELLSDVLRSNAHAAVAHRIRQRAGQPVNQAAVAHLAALTHAFNGVRRLAHHLNATGDGQLRITRDQLLGSGNDRLNTGTAQTVHTICVRTLWHAGLKRNGPGGVVIARNGGDNVGPHSGIKLVGRNAGRFDHGLSKVGTKVDRGHLG